MSDAVERLNAALEGRYAIEREVPTAGCGHVDGADTPPVRRAAATVTIAINAAFLTRLLLSGRMSTEHLDRFK